MRPNLDTVRQICFYSADASDLHHIFLVAPQRAHRNLFSTLSGALSNFKQDDLLAIGLRTQCMEDRPPPRGDLAGGIAIDDVVL